MVGDKDKLTSASVRMPASVSELLIQANFGSQAHLHLAADTLAAWGNRGDITFTLLAADLYLANTGDVYPFPTGDFLCQHLQIAFNGFADEGFGQAPTLASDVGNTLCVIHDWLLLNVKNLSVV
jgi:hypothetical protein